MEHMLIQRTGKRLVCCVQPRLRRTPTPTHAMSLKSVHLHECCTTWVGMRGNMYQMYQFLKLQKRRRLHVQQIWGGGLTRLLQTDRKVFTPAVQQQQVCVTYHPGCGLGHKRQRKMRAVLRVARRSGQLLANVAGTRFTIL